MPVQPALAYPAVASSLFPFRFPSVDVDSHIARLNAALHADESPQPYHIDCPHTRLPVCRCAHSGVGSAADGSGGVDSSQLWSAAVRESGAAIAELLGEQSAPDKHKLYAALRSTRTDCDDVYEQTPAAEWAVESRRNLTLCPPLSLTPGTVTCSLCCAAPCCLLPQRSSHRAHRWRVELAAAGAALHTVSASLTLTSERVSNQTCALC